MRGPRPHRGRRAALGFVGLIAALAILSVALPDRLKVAGFGTPDSESARATDTLHRALGYDPEPGMAVLAHADEPFTRAPARAALEDVARQIGRDRGVAHLEAPLRPGGSRILLSRDRREALILVHFKQPGEQAAAPVIDRIRGSVHSDSLRVQYGGFDVGFQDDNRIVRRDLLLAELIAFPILALLLIWVFRGLAAALLPLVIGGLAVLGSFAGLKLLAHVFDVSVYSLNLAAALGLGLAVDYGLFLVTRYREETARGSPSEEALKVTMGTAGRAVMFSGLTVAGACAALVIFPQTFIYSMGVGGALTALIAAVAALVVVPPLLPRVAQRTRPGSRTATRIERDLSAGLWYRFSRWVMRHPAPVAVISAIAMLGLAVPALHLRLTFLDSKALPHGLESRTVADTIARDFIPYLEFPISVAVRHPLAERPAAVDALQARLASLPGAGVVSSVQRAPDGTRLLQLLPRAPPLSQTSERLIADIRRLDPALLVGGRPADFVDLKASISSHAGPSLAVVTVATLIVFFFLTASVVLPIKAVLMNSLTVFAVFGVLVAVFQDRFAGIGSLFAYDGPNAIETSISVVVIGVTLGLATDYSILLLSRIKEEHDSGLGNEEAVAVGLERSGRVITNAALLLAVALIALAWSRVFLVQELVVGLAVGVAIDATIVRACLVPALMRMLGRANWWAPRPLRALVPAARSPRRPAASESPPSRRR